ncbi:unnamed protein product [Lasius platythorax]|uniref:Uncharacterized protein n=1 Tax=Lasius platythorax TaxID=488582 RepID=A0AAV2P0M6_9HYME
MVPDCLITRVRPGSFVYKRWRLRGGDDVGSYVGAVQQSRLNWQRRGVAGEEISGHTETTGAKQPSKCIRGGAHCHYG